MRDRSDYDYRGQPPDQGPRGRQDFGPEDAWDANQGWQRDNPYGRPRRQDSPAARQGYPNRPGELMYRPDLMQQSSHSESGFAREGGQGTARGGYWGQGGAEPAPARGPYTGRGPRGYRRSDDRIFEDVCEALTEHGDIDAGEIEVAVQNGEVTLTGTVADRRQKRLAEDIVESCSGVQDVHNQLRVQGRLEPPTGQGHGAVT